MPRYNARTCEPFRAWNRLEARPRKYDFDQVLKAGVHDPLWFLTRQWQFGEFKGEDTGSPVLAKLSMQTTRMSKVKPYGQLVAETYDDSTPLEQTVEQVQRTVSYKERIHIGEYWLKLVDHYGLEFNDTNPSEPPYDRSTYLSTFLNLYPLDIPEEDLTQANDEVARDGQLLCNKKLMNYLEVFGSRIPDGAIIWEASYYGSFVKDIRSDVSHDSFLASAVSDLQAWIPIQYPELNSFEDAWNENQMEYQLKASFPESGSINTVAVAEEYYSGKLDWYNFDIATETDDAEGLNSSTSDEKDDHRNLEVFSFIPTEATFPGMPHNRFWEFEDAKVDLGNINAETTDVSKVVVVEFATIYGNNWFLFPYELEVGSLAQVNGIVVTDVFGQKTLVEPAIQGDVDDWYGWGMFNLTKWDKNKSGKEAADTRLFLPPSVAKMHESETVEEIIFARDEMANLVWAIETRIDDLLHQGMNGHQAAVHLSNYLDGIFGNDSDTTVDEEAVLRYILANSVPENWIPFITIHIPGQNRDVQLQRASMPRVLDDQTFPIRPRTGILRHGLNSNDTQTEKYIVHEEEVPRTGIRVRAAFQRTRWYQGKVVQWYGYQKTLGRGEGGSGLQFDRVEMLKKHKS